MIGQHDRFDLGQITHQRPLPRVQYGPDNEPAESEDDGGLAGADREQRARGTRAGHLHANAEQKSA